MTDQAIPYTPVDVPLPPVPSREIFSEIQWTTLLAIADTVIPSIRGPSARPSASTRVIPQSQLNTTVATLAASIDDPDAVTLATRYLEESASSNLHFRDTLQRLFADYVHEQGRNGLSLILNALKYVSDRTLQKLDIH